MSKTATPTLTTRELGFDLVDVMDEEEQAWLPLGEPEEVSTRASPYSFFVNHTNQLCDGPVTMHVAKGRG